MRSLLFALAACTLLFATAPLLSDGEEPQSAPLISLELEEGIQGRVHYEISEHGAQNATLYLIVKEGEEQRSVETLEGFNGYAEGELIIFEPGTYTITVFDETTGGLTDKNITIAQKQVPPSLAEKIEEMEEAAEQEQSTLEVSGGESGWVLGLLIVAVLAILAILFIFGNPLKAKSAKKK